MSCAGVEVASGDLVRGDEDGVVVVPAALAADALAAAEEKLGLERIVAEALERGETRRRALRTLRRSLRDVVGEWRTQRQGSAGPDWARSEWARPGQVACRLCGRPLFGRVWSAAVDGVAADFCDPDCETLFVEYWLPRHGDSPAPGA